MNESENTFPMDITDPSSRPWKFRPEGYLVVILAGTEEAQRAESALVPAGFGRSVTGSGCLVSLVLTLILVLAARGGRDVASALPATNLTPEDIEVNLKQYLGDRSDSARYASFDYCYNYFQSFYTRGRLEDVRAPEHLQTSCLQIGFYLASWGMFRRGVASLARQHEALHPAARSHR